MVVFNWKIFFPNRHCTTLVFTLVWSVGKRNASRDWSKLSTFGKLEDSIGTHLVASEAVSLYQVLLAALDVQTQTVPGTLDSWNMLGAMKTPKKKANPWSTNRTNVIVSNFDLDQDCKEVLNEGFILAKSYLRMWRFMPPHNYCNVIIF